MRTVPGRAGRKARLAYLTVSRIQRGHAARVQAITTYKLALALEVDIEALMPAPAPSASQSGQAGRRGVVRAGDPPATRAT